MVAGYEPGVFLRVIEHKGEDTVESVDEVGAILFVERQNDLAVGTRLKLISSSKLATDILMVVYLAIDGEHLLAIGREQWLTTREGIYDSQSLMCQNGISITIDSAPIGTAVSYLSRHS